MLVIGPNRVFLRYIEQVLPSLGEAGVEQVVLADLVPDVEFARPATTGDDWLAARVKGDVRMADVIDKAVRDRERPLRDDLVVPFRAGYLRLRVDEQRASSSGAAALPPPQRRSPVRRGRGLVGAGRQLAGRRVTPDESARRCVAHRRGPRRARADVAGAHTGAAAARPVRLEGAAAARRPRRARPTTSTTSLYRPRSDDGRRGALDRRRRRAARRGPRGARSEAGTERQGEEPTRSAPTATSSIDEVQDLTPMQLRMARAVRSTAR